MSERSPRGPPSASRAASSSPHTLLMMYGVQALAPMSRRVSQARIIAISFRSPGGEMGVPILPVHTKRIK